MKTLVHGQQVKMDQPLFRHRVEVTVGTIEGSAKQYNEDPKPQLDRAIANKHQLAWTLQSAAVISSNYKGKAEELARKAAAFAAATVLENGEEVEIEGRKYTVKYMGDYSDPIHFIPAK